MPLCSAFDSLHILLVCYVSCVVLFAFTISTPYVNLFDRFGKYPWLTTIYPTHTQFQCSLVVCECVSTCRYLCVRVSTCRYLGGFIQLLLSVSEYIANACE